MLDQLLVGAAPGDAITLSALKLRDALRESGDSEVYAAFPEPILSDEVHPLKALASRPNRERPLIFHASIGCEQVHEAIRSLEPTLVLVYHNMSPADSFERYAPEVAADLTRGRWELEDIRERVILSVADSQFNASELVELGYTDVHVIPPLPDTGRVLNCTPEIRPLRRLQAQRADPVILFIGQQLPHKRVDRVIAAVAVLQQEFFSDARLVIAGVERFPAYTASLKEFAATVGLMGDPFVGRLTDEELTGFLMGADVFLTLSDHEGFCVPVVEAMAVGTPVVASSTAAIPETVGDAGVLVTDPDDPMLVAALMNEVIVNQSLAHELRGRGVARAEELGVGASLTKYLDLLDSELGIPA